MHAQRQSFESEAMLSRGLGRELAPSVAVLIRTQDIWPEAYTTHHSHTDKKKDPLLSHITEYGIPLQAGFQLDPAGPPHFQFHNPAGSGLIFAWKPASQSSAPVFSPRHTKLTQQPRRKPNPFFKWNDPAFLQTHKRAIFG